MIDLVDTVISAKVNPDIKARLIKAAGSNGRTVNAVIKDLVNDYLDGKDKLAHPTKYTPTEKAEKLEIVPPEDEIIEVEGVGEISETEFRKVIRDAFREYLKKSGYTLVKTDALKKLLAVLEAKKKAKTKAKEKDDFVCPECNYTSKSKFKYCPKCGEELTWED